MNCVRWWEKEERRVDRGVFDLWPFALAFEKDHANVWVSTKWVNRIINDVYVCKRSG